MTVLDPGAELFGPQTWQLWKGCVLVGRGYIPPTRPGPARLSPGGFLVEAQPAWEMPNRAASLHLGKTAAGSRHRQSENKYLLTIVMWLCALTLLPPPCLLLLCICSTPPIKLHLLICVHFRVTVYIFSGNESLRYQLHATAVSTACIDAQPQGSSPHPEIVTIWKFTDSRNTLYVFFQPLSTYFKDKEICAVLPKQM